MVMIPNVGIVGFVRCGQDQLSVSLLSFSGDNNSVTCAGTHRECFGGGFFCLMFSWP